MQLGDHLNRISQMVCDTAFELIRIFVNQAAHEYKLLDKINSDEQKIAVDDPHGISL